MSEETKKILVIGASSGIGFETSKQALAAGFAVRAFSRNVQDMALGHEMLEKVPGDALEREDVQNALKTCKAVVLCLGVPLNLSTVLRGTTLFSEATAVLLPAMQEAGVQRLICVTGFGAGDSASAIPLWQRPVFKAVLERIYRDKSIQERQIKESRLDWTIVRPTVLTDGEKTRGYEVLTDPKEFRGGRVKRSQVADFIVSELTNDKHIRLAPVITR